MDQIVIDKHFKLLKRVDYSIGFTLRYESGGLALESATFAIIGGDMRNVYIKEILKADGHFVRSFAVSDSEMSQCKSIESAIENCKYIIGPTPFSVDGTFLNTPLIEKKLYVDDFLCALQPKQKLFAGSVSKACREMFDQFQIDAIDFLSKKELAVLNAIPTAEGALKIAIENSPVTIHGSKALVVGHGNIGKILAKYLNALGAKTYVAAKRPESLAEAFGNGARSVKIEEIGSICGKMDYIFNTVPSNIIEPSDARKIGGLYIELASSPYGTDINAATKSGVNIINAPSLPGKLSPKTTAKYIVQTIYNIIQM